MVSQEVGASDLEKKCPVAIRELKQAMISFITGSIGQSAVKSEEC